MTRNNQKQFINGLRWSAIGMGLAGSGLIWVSSAVAQQQVLTRAEVYRLQNQVQLLLRNQSPRAARLQDTLAPLDSVRTSSASIAELLFNEGSIARVDQNTTFFFRQGLRRFQLPNRIAMNEAIFVLEDGIALIMSPPNSVGTQIETPEGQISIHASPTSAAVPAPEMSVASMQPVFLAWLPGSPTGNRLPEVPLLSQEAEPADLLLPPDRSSVVMVVHDAAQNATQVFALTDGEISVADSQGNTVSLLGGQTVGVRAGELGDVQEFDLETFYRTVPLAAGLGPGQENFVAQEPIAVQPTLTAVRQETLAAVRRQARAQDGFGSSFLRDALSGSDSDFNGQRGESGVVIIQDANTITQEGTFIRSPDDDPDSSIVNGVFIPDATADDPSPGSVDIRADLDSQTGTIGNQAGESSSAGLSGNNAVGTVRLDNGRVIRIEVFEVGGEAPEPGEPFRGRLIQGGLEPDR